MKKLLLLPLILCIATCEPAYTMGHKKPVPVATATPSPSPLVQGPSEPATSGVPVISVGQITGATPAEVAMIADGVKLINRSLAGPCIKQWVLAATYTENNGLSQAQIWDLITAHRVPVDVEMYTGDWKANHIAKTIGYENDPFDGVVHMNRYFVRTAYMVADNLIHEDKGHSPGFHHYGKFSTSEPYGMNYAFEGCYNQQQQAKGGKRFKPPGIRLEIRRASHGPRRKKLKGFSKRQPLRSAH